MENEIPRGHLSTIILSTLLDGDKYGYEILKAVEKQTNGIIKIKQPSLYSSLKRMEDQNLISSYWRDSDIGGRRHYYRLTDLGRKQTIEWQKDLVTSQKCVKEIINRFFGGWKFRRRLKTFSSLEPPKKGEFIEEKDGIKVSRVEMIFPIKELTELELKMLKLFDAYFCVGADSVLFDKLRTKNGRICCYNR